MLEFKIDDYFYITRTRQVFRLAEVIRSEHTEPNYIFGDATAIRYKLKYKEVLSLFDNIERFSVCALVNEDQQTVPIRRQFLIEKFNLEHKK